MNRTWLISFIGLTLLTGTAVWYSLRKETDNIPLPIDKPKPTLQYKPYLSGLYPTSGLYAVTKILKPWEADASLKEIADIWDDAGFNAADDVDKRLKYLSFSDAQRTKLLFEKARYLLYENEPRKAYEIITDVRKIVERDDTLAEQVLYTIIYFQGVTGLRLGETENCIECRGESSCILPIAPAAIHLKPEGSRLAIRHFNEYLEQFPDAVDVHWLLNLAHATLGEHPHKVPERFRISLDHFVKSEHSIGQFRDIGHLVRLNRLNQSGGAILDDFNNDGLLDVFVTSFDATMHAAFYQSMGDGTFQDCSSKAGLLDQLGGLNCVQADYNNDGFLDVLIVRGAWLRYPIRPSLLRNNGNGTFTDVTKEAGLLEPANSITATWADYDNDGHLDLYFCCETSYNRLYRNQGDGTFTKVTDQAGVKGNAGNCKGANWIDYDNDNFPDLFVSYNDKLSQLFHNERNGTFTDVTKAMGIDGPDLGFSCWAWDYNNDGWLDVFATCYDFSLESVVAGMQGKPHKRLKNRLWQNQKGKGFQDVTKEAGLDLVFATMGSNFGDFDNDGFLDAYLGTGEPGINFIVPNRMLKNLEGKRFVDITGSSRTGNLQKGHGVGCGDWDRDGDVDIFIQMGGATDGDMYHNILFQNPGQGNRSLTIRLIGKKTNRAAIGARIKLVTTGEKPLTVYRHISSGSSFGANPLQQTIGVGKAKSIKRLEIHWPTSNTTQVFHEVDLNQAIEITEFDKDYRRLDWKPIPLPDSGN